MGARILSIPASIESQVSCSFAQSAIKNILREIDAGAGLQESIDHEVELLVSNGAKSSARQVIKFFQENK